VKKLLRLKLIELPTDRQEEAEEAEIHGNPCGNPMILTSGY